eukprot:TRINITY_DN6488_c0_g1_i1.p1 TRINITY_DN6488_c0_g1~~TRINITY_DN6488_c0_g1_i1.p1  ORF type:complete len:430 (-),score=74.62 TRINITY_DN6488_c0_g1_i1:83-1309(-)
MGHQTNNNYEPPNNTYFQMDMPYHYQTNNGNMNMNHENVYHDHHIYAPPATNPRPKYSASKIQATRVEIGHWCWKSFNPGETLCRIHYRKGQLVWEFERMNLKYKIINRFEDILRIGIDEAKCTLTIELRRPPRFYIANSPSGSKRVEWVPTTDFTMGEAYTCRYHIIEFDRSIRLKKHFDKLLNCDDQIRNLSSGYTISIDPNDMRFNAFHMPISTPLQEASIFSPIGRYNQILPLNEVKKIKHTPHPYMYFSEFNNPNSVEEPMDFDEIDISNFARDFEERRVDNSLDIDISDFMKNVEDKNNSPESAVSNNTTNDTPSSQLEYETNSGQQPPDYETNDPQPPNMIYSDSLPVPVDNFSNTNSLFGLTPPELRMDYGNNGTFGMDIDFENHFNDTWYPNIGQTYYH